MHCENARPLLPLHTYGDLTDSERTAVEEHLTLCAACRLELSEFQALRENLNAQSLAVQTVDLARIYQPQTRRLQRQAWRWRLAALAGVAVALFVLFTRLEIQANAGQLVVRWGKPEPVAAVDKPVIVTAPTPKRVEPSREMLERLQV
ncbi:MAG TPA: zf-HC2 domain-containing protein, partial [Gemmataceae bacterium]|nr:zf-HC2 domain-containing protein [Gemmataceae bacterium]